VVDVEEVVPLVVGAGRIFDCYLCAVSIDLAAKSPEGCCCGLDGASVEGPCGAVFELSGEDEGHVVDADVVGSSRGKEETIEHALLADAAGSLEEGFGVKVDDVEIRQQVVNDGEPSIGP